MALIPFTFSCTCVYLFLALSGSKSRKQKIGHWADPKDQCRGHNYDNNDGGCTDSDP